MLRWEKRAAHVTTVGVVAATTTESGHIPHMGHTAHTTGTTAPLTAPLTAPRTAPPTAPLHRTATIDWHRAQPGEVVHAVKLAATSRLLFRRGNRSALQLPLARMVQAFATRATSIPDAGGRVWGWSEVSADRVSLNLLADRGPCTHTNLSPHSVDALVVLCSDPARLGRTEWWKQHSDTTARSRDSRGYRDSNPNANETPLILLCTAPSSTVAVCEPDRSVYGIIHACDYDHPLDAAWDAVAAAQMAVLRPRATLVDPNVDTACKHIVSVCKRPSSEAAEQFAVFCRAAYGHAVTIPADGHPLFPLDAGSLAAHLRRLADEGRSLEAWAVLRAFGYGADLRKGVVRGAKDFGPRLIH